MNILHTIWWFWLHLFWLFAAAIDIYLIVTNTPRLMRGKVRRTMYMKWGFKVPVIQMFFCLTLFTTSIVLALIGHFTLSVFFVNFYWTVVVVVDIIDYLTGGDDPGKRIKKFVSEKIKKLKINPIPKPVIQIQ